MTTAKKDLCREAEVNRQTRETQITAKLALDGQGQVDCKTGIGFFDHMIDQLGRHALIDISLNAKGDLHIDAHHTIEDCGWALGAALSDALGDRRGIRRYGDALTPMDEALTQVAVDLSGRPYLVWDVTFPSPKLGEVDTEVFQEFFQAFTSATAMTLHIRNLYGTNAHHIIESCFKATARALRYAIAIDPKSPDSIPSTKGALGRGR